MRILCSVVRIFDLNVLNAWHQPFHCDTITAQTVGGCSSRKSTLYPQDLSEKPLRYSRVSMALNDNIDHFAFLVDRSPKVLISTIDLQVDLIQMPSIPEGSSEPCQAPRVLCPKLGAQHSDRLQLTVTPRSNIISSKFR